MDPKEKKPMYDYKISRHVAVSILLSHVWSPSALITTSQPYPTPLKKTKKNTKMNQRQKTNKQKKKERLILRNRTDLY